MEHVQIQTAHNVGIQVEVAGLGDRFIAALIDYCLLGAYYAAVGILYLFLKDVSGFSAPFLSIVLLPALLYFLLCEVYMEGQSIGKRIRNIKVARLDGTEPTLGNYLVRWVFRLVDVVLGSGLVGIVTLFVNGKGQRLGDLAAGTTVIRVHPRVQLRDTLFAHLDEAYQPTFQQVEMLSKEDVETAKEVIQVLYLEGKKRGAHTLSVQAKAALERKMGITSDLVPLEFLRRVVKDYNYVVGHV